MNNFEILQDIAENDKNRGLYVTGVFAHVSGIEKIYSLRHTEKQETKSQKNRFFNSHVQVLGTFEPSVTIKVTSFSSRVYFVVAKVRTTTLCRKNDRENIRSF